MTIKELCSRLKIKLPLARAMLADGLVPAKKVKGAWHIEEQDLARLQEAWQAFRAAMAFAPPVPVGPAKGRCPNCHQHQFGPTPGRGWGEFHECAQCQFSIHEHNLGSPALVANAIREFRNRPRVNR